MENYYLSYKQLKLILRSFKYAKLYLFKENYLKKKGKCFYWVYILFVEIVGKKCLMQNYTQKDNKSLS